MNAIKKAEPALESKEFSLITTDANNTKSRSRKAAINQHCRNCIYDDTQPGTWRKQVAECTSFNCALYAFRPTPSDSSSKQINALENSENSVFVLKSGGVNE